MKNIKQLLAKVGGQIIATDTAKVLKQIAKDVGLPKSLEEWTPALFKMALAGEDFEPADNLDAAERKQALALWKAITKALQAHKDCEAEQVKEAARAEKEQAASRDAIILAAPKGVEVAEKFTEVGLDGLNSMVKRVSNGCFEATATGLKLVKGAEPEAKDFAFLIGALANSSEGLDRVKASVTWAMGDAVLAIKTGFPDEADEMVQQVVSVLGKQKHTIREAEKLAREWKPEDRMPELTATHHQELSNYRHLIPKAKFEKIIEEVLEGEIDNSLKLSNGKEIEQRKPLSCAKTRKLLQEAAGRSKDKDDGGNNEPVKHEKPGFLYIDPSTGELFFHKEFAPKAVPSLKVVDLEALCLVGEDGQDGDKLADLSELPASWFKGEAVKAPKPKKEKKPKDEPVDDGLPG